MKKSAMALAFQTLRRKPMVLLLLLPVPIISVIVSAISLQTLPDLNKMLDMNYLMNYASGMETTQSMMISNMISMLVSSVSMILSLCSLFLLVPAAMEMLADGAAGRETAPGWFTRGMRRHWWKPITDSSITGGIFAVLFIPLYIVFIILVSLAVTGMTMGTITNYSDSSSLDSINGIMSGIVTPLLIAVIVFAGIVYVLELLVSSVFGLFLPALADRGFGEAFKLLFSKKGFRKLPRMLGGKALITLVPGFIYTALYAVYLLITGLPADVMGYLINFLSFMKSWAGILGLLLMSIIGILVYPFRFGVHQLIRDEEASLPIQIQK